MTNNEMIAVIQAHEDGKAIQCRLDDLQEWRNVTKPQWNFHEFEYRVKPEPIKPREFWLVNHMRPGEDSACDLCGPVLNREIAAIRAKGDEVIHVREVLPDQA